MEPEELVAAVDATLDQAADFGILFAVATIAAIAMRLSKGNELPIAGLRVPRSLAAVGLRVFYAFILIAFLVLLARLAGLLSQLDEASLKPALTRILSHESLFNPFAYVGGNLWGDLASGAPLALFTIVWWLGAACLSLLSLRAELATLVTGSAFTALGIVLCLAGNEFFGLLVDAALTSDPGLASALAKWAGVRSSVLAWSSLAGILAAAAVLLIAERPERLAEG